MNSTNLIGEAGDLTNSLSGLKIFVNDHFTLLDSITRDDLSALIGLVASIDMMSSAHYDHVIDCLEGSE